MVYEPVDLDELGVTRRQFFNRSILAGSGLGLGAFGVAALAFLWPSSSGGFGGKVSVGSEADAKAAFDKQPQLFAPVSGGNDIVLLRSKVTKEGSLDFAVWFRNRLYLFTSQKTLEQFVAAPKEFVISE